MPDPRLYVMALAAGSGVSALVVWAIGYSRGAASEARANAAGVLGVGFGLAAGIHLLRLWPAWPPATGLGRLVTIVLPAVIAIELLATFARVPRWLAWLSRSLLALATVWVLLHGSIYLGGRHSPWTVWQAGFTLPLAGALLFADWALVAWLHARSPAIATPLAIAEACLAAGLCVMLRGYVSGGEAALPVAAALAGAALASARRPRAALREAIGVGVVGLFGLLFIGRFFGGLSTAEALTVFLAPLACWATEIPGLRCRRPWLLASIQLALVAVPLAAVLFLAKRDFDRHTAPLLTAAESPPAIQAADAGSVPIATMAGFGR